jgi:hypothetical protein
LSAPQTSSWSGVLVAANRGVIAYIRRPRPCQRSISAFDWS